VSIEKPGDPSPKKQEEGEKSGSDRREFISNLLMGGGVLASYGFLAGQGCLFLMPPNKEVPTRQLFIGVLDHFHIGTVQETYDLENNLILIKRLADKEDPESSEPIPTFQAFSSVCPHLGCKVFWREKEQDFLCPCHNGIFDSEGAAISGPPAKARQSLSQIPVQVDRDSGRVYLEVKDPGRRNA